MTDNTKVRELLPCPFCGGNDLYFPTTGFKEDSQGYIVSCCTEGCPASNMSVDDEFCTATVDWDSEEEAIAAWNKRAWQAAQAVAVVGEPDRYDAGLLNDFGGGNVGWWQDYIRAELARAHEFYTSQWPTHSITATELERIQRNDERYRWLREQTWNESNLCAVHNPKDAVKLGHDCPSHARLDEAIDAAIAQGKGE